jgi:hypothetical protein
LKVATAWSNASTSAESSHSSPPFPISAAAAAHYATTDLSLDPFPPRRSWWSEKNRLLPKAHQAHQNRPNKPRGGLCPVGPLVAQSGAIRREACGWRSRHVHPLVGTSPFLFLLFFFRLPLSFFFVRCVWASFGSVLHRKWATALLPKGCGATTLFTGERLKVYNYCTSCATAFGRSPQPPKNYSLFVFTAFSHKRSA